MSDPKFPQHRHDLSTQTISWRVGCLAFQLNDDLTQIQGMSSREGEAVHFSELISLEDFPKIDDWLVRIESMMRTSLASLLTHAVVDLREFYGQGSRLNAEQSMTCK